MQSPAEKLTAGWREMVALPAWGIRRIRAKLDTGARTSAIHVSRIEELDGDRIRFEVVFRERPVRRTRWIEAEAIRDAHVKPSHGEVQRRKVVRTLMRMGPLEHEIELGLVCREGMLCRMLLGRKALEGLVVVDPGARYLLSALSTAPANDPASKPAKDSRK